MRIDIESLERATLDAVAPFAMEALPGWLLPFDSSTVGRAISAVPLQHHSIDPSDVSAITSRYAKRGLKAQFRVADKRELTALHNGLSAQGYLAQQPTLTMVGLIPQSRKNSGKWAIQLSETDVPPVSVALGFGVRGLI